MGRSVSSVVEPQTMSTFLPGASQTVGFSLRARVPMATKRFPHGTVNGVSTRPKCAPLTKTCADEAGLWTVKRPVLGGSLAEPLVLADADATGSVWVATAVLGVEGGATGAVADGAGISPIDEEAAPAG